VLLLHSTPRINFPMLLRLLLLLLSCSLTAAAGIVEDVRFALGRNDFQTASNMLAAYRSQRGVDAEYVDALSWVGRAALGTGDLEQANKAAQETQKLALQLLTNAKLDSQPHLSNALGAAFEVQAQALSKKSSAAPASGPADIRPNLHSCALAEESQPVDASRQTRAAARDG
jgi:hypothetical protein